MTTFDLRQAVRGLRRRPGVPLLVVAILALGLGGFLALWSAADAVLWRPLGYAAPEQLVRLWGSGNGDKRNNTNPLDARDWEARAHSFSDLAIFNANQDTVSGLGDGPPEYLPVARVSANFFHTLGVEPALGRFCAKREETLGEHRVAVLSWEQWQSRFAGADVLGRKLALDGKPYVIVGVAPRGFAHPIPNLSRPAALYRPFAFDPKTTGRGGHWVQTFARLKRGVTVAAAQAELDAI